MAQSIDPLHSFTHLVDNVPQWLVKLDELSVQCDEQYERFYKLTKNGHFKLTRKKKHDSTESLRGKGVVEFSPLLPQADIEEETNGMTHQADDRSRASQSHAAMVASMEQTRKRKPASDFSAASGANRYRTKSMIVVYYDSAIQEGFEGIVRHIANARSTLRKGRTTATFQSRMAAMDFAMGNDSPLGDALDPKSVVASFARPRMAAGAASEKQKYKTFDEADRDLEEAQNLSEKAAHQFLRDGNSKAEIEGIKRRFKAVQALAMKEAQRLKAANTSSSAIESKTEASERSTGKKIEPDPPPAKFQYPSIVENGSPSPVKAEFPPPSPSRNNGVPPLSNGSTKQLNFVAAGMIEVDDAASDASSVKIDIAAIRRVTARRA